MILWSDLMNYEVAKDCLHVGEMIPTNWMIPTNYLFLCFNYLELPTNSQALAMSKFIFLMNTCTIMYPCTSNV